MSGISFIELYVFVLAGADYGTLATWLGFIAVTSSSLNVIGGFLITDRMVRMFKRSGSKR